MAAGSREVNWIVSTSCGDTEPLIEYLEFLKRDVTTIDASWYYQQLESGSYPDLISPYWIDDETFRKECDRTFWLASIREATLLQKSHNPIGNQYSWTQLDVMLGEELLNSDYIIVPFHKLKGYSGSFCKPLTAVKLCDGQIIGPEGKLDYIGHIMDDELFTVSPTQIVGREWRFWIGDKGIITYSQYGRNHILKLTPQYVIDYAEKMVDILGLGFYVLDVCEVFYGEGNDIKPCHSLKVTEINDFQMSGLYSWMDIPAYVEAVEKYYKEVLYPYDR